MENTYAKDGEWLRQTVFNVIYDDPQLPSGIRHALACIGESCSLSRVYIFENNEANTHSSNTFEWCAEGIEPQQEYLQHMSFADYDYHAMFDDSGLCCCPNVSLLPETLKNLFEQQGIHATLQYAIYDKGVFRGFIGFDDCTRTRPDWRDDQDSVDTLIYISKLLSICLLKERNLQKAIQYHEALQRGLEQKARHSQSGKMRAEEKMRIAMAHSQLAIWECLFAARTNVYTAETVERFHFPAEITDVPEGIIRTGGICADSQDKLRRMYAAVMAGEAHAAGEIATLRDGRTQWWNIMLTTVYEDGKPVSAVGTAEDITREKSLILQMEDEIFRRGAYDDPDILGKIYCDLTVDSLLEFNAPRLLNGQNPQASYSSLAALTALQIPDSQEREKFCALFERENLLNIFADGKTMEEYEYRRQVPEGNISWVSTRVSLLRQPSTGHTVAFIHTRDINRQKQSQAVLRATTQENYEHIVLIDMRSGHYQVFASSPAPVLPLPLCGCDYWGTIKAILRPCVPDAAYQEILNTRDPAAIARRLEGESVCAYVTRVTLANGNSRTQKIQYAYLDDSRQALLMTCMDITAALGQEQRQREILESALLAAKQASSAKSNFLSRMSHEIRTPMNAILGMVALATQATGREEEMLDCIAKIGISGHYLLSLINDILDMSRIESGKMLLHAAPFNFAEFINGITTVIYGQAVQKNIHYEALMDHGLEEDYIGDAMKLQQVLINILGNAVKFTPQKGRVTLSVSLVSRTETNATLRFAVNDTGCGITEEALGRIFEPFEQQDNTITSSFGGSGLGLAISKNLVELMGGSIRVRSIINVGSEFVIEIPLQVDQSLSIKRPLHPSFQNLHTLIVDDDQMVCEQTAQVLQDIGMIPEWVTSGKEAVDKVRSQWKQRISYDFVLIDWKMPEMDGIETARQIRGIVGPDVTIIIITAYNWANIEQQARDAGVNMCISKPMMKSTLISAFSRAAGEVEQSRAQHVEPEFDFSGRRILLAEDHPLNAEITTRLLDKKHAVVDVAVNGLKALEMFTRTPSGYYDAILMDVRMPLMDGLQAATNIRHWNKEDAKRIPIIALTANAFEEDVQRSKAAGMDAHLAKPLDPEKLYRTLHRLMK